MYTQEQLDQIWQDITNGNFAGSPGDAPEQIVDDESGQVLRIPTETEQLLYGRKGGGDWQPVPVVGTTREFE